MLEPPKEATSPSCRGIWMESWRRRPRRRWSQKPVALATCLNKTAGGKDEEEKRRGRKIEVEVGGKGKNGKQEEIGQDKIDKGRERESEEEHMERK